MGARWLAVRGFGQTDDGAERGARSHNRPDLKDDCSRAMLLGWSDRDSSRFGSGYTTESGRFRSRGSDGTLRLLLLGGAVLRAGRSRGRMRGVLRRSQLGGEGRC